MADPGGSIGGSFPATSWSLVFRLRDAGGDAKKAAFDELARLYLAPVRRFFAKVIGRRGVERARAESTAEELSQAFFARFWEKDFAKSLVEKGSFRGFLKVACRAQYANWCDAERVRRPEQGRALLRLQDAEGAALDVPVSDDELGRLFDESDREWILEECVERTRRRLTGAGKEACVRAFDRFQEMGEDRPNRYEALAEELKVKLFDVKNRLHAFRKELALELHAEASRRRPDDPEEELCELGLWENVKGFVQPSRKPKPPGAGADGRP